MSIKLATICSGIGAPEEAARPLGWEPIWCAEIEPFPSAVLAARHGEAVNLGDMTAPDFVSRALAAGMPDVIVAGTPCQAFSVAGRREGLADSRGNLTLRFVEIVDELRAVGFDGYVLWENVPGVLSDKTNAFGCLLAGLVGADSAIVARDGWPSAGVVAGPAGTAAWRVLDAQYFGVAQRRRRVFVVLSVGDRADSPEILFEFEGVRRDSAPSREAGEGTAPTIAARTRGGGGLGTDAECDGALIAASVTSKWAKGSGGPAGDECQNLVAHSLRAEGHDASEDGTGRGTPIVPVVAGTMKSCAQSGGFSNSVDHAAAGYMVPVAFTCKDNGADAGEVAPTLRSMGHDDSHANGGGQVAVAIPILEPGSRTGVSTNDPRCSDGVGTNNDPMFTLQATRPHGVAVAFAQNQRDEVRTMDVAGALAGEPGMKQQTYVGVLAIRGRDDGSNLEYRQDGTANAVLTPSGGRGGIGVGAIHSGMAVRRLTPRECERLQGFPDDYTDIQFRGKPAADGPRYKGLGNSMAVPCVRWILRRIGAAITPGSGRH